MCDFKHRRNTVVSDIFKKSGLSQKFIDTMLEAYSPPVDQCRLRGAEGVAYNVHFCFDHEVSKVGDAIAYCGLRVIQRVTASQ